LIATVLLIASVIAVAGIISVWLTSFARTTTSNVETMATNQTKCAGTYLKIDNVKSLGGYTGTSNTNTTIIYSNPSSQPIGSINIIAIPGNETIYGATSSLASGGVSSAYLNLTNSTRISIKGVCLASVGVEGACLSTDTCWNA